MPLPDIQDAIDLIEQGAPAEAIPLLEAVAERMPTYVAVHAMMARAYEAEQQQEDARAAWERAAFLMPNSPAICEGLARVRTALQATRPAPDERLRVDLDLLAELDAALETPFNPFARPPQSETTTVDLDEDRPVSLAEASLALIERALSEAQMEAEETTAQTETPPEEEEETPIDDSEASAQTLAARRALDAEAAAQERTALSSEDEEDLDRLIDELGAARIVPQPDVDDLPPPDLDDDIDDMVSETLARIYASQEQYAEAARIYEQLARQQPDQAERFLAEAAAMWERE